MVSDFSFSDYKTKAPRSLLKELAELKDMDSCTVQALTYLVLESIFWWHSY